MKKLYSILLALLLGSASLASNNQGALVPVRELMNRLIYINTKTLNKVSDDRVLKLTDSLAKMLDSVSDEGLKDEARFQISSALLNLSNQQRSRPIYLENLLLSLNRKDMEGTAKAYRQGIIANLHKL